jgi:hypothetical protein
MMSLKRIGATAVLVMALFGFSLAQDSVTISILGYVSDFSGIGIKGASVKIKNANLTEITRSVADSVGIYKFDNIQILNPNAILHPVRNSTLSYRPVLRSDGLYFNAPQNTQNVRLELFTLSGRKSAELVNTTLGSGNYHVDPFTGISASQSYLLRLRIGDQVSYFKLCRAGNLHARNSLVQKLGNEASALPPAKRAATAAVIDSLIVSANGFISESRPLESYSGAHYVFLHTTADAAKKKLTVSYTLNSGDPNIDPVPTRLTAIWVENTSNVFQKSMFVCYWLATEGYKYNVTGKETQCCPQWRDSTSWANTLAMDTQTVDAVTKASPNFGKCTFDYNPELLGLAAGTYKFCIETHVESPYNIEYSGSLAIGGAAGEVTPSTPAYFPTKHPAMSVDALSGVKISYK